MTMFEFIKNLTLSAKKELFNQKFWQNQDVAIFAKYNHLTPTLENITQNERVLKLLMSFDKKPSLNKFLKLSQHTFTKDDKNYPTLNVLYFYLMKNGSLFIKDRSYHKKQYIMSQDNTHYSLPLLPPIPSFFSTSEMNFLVVIDAFQTDIHYHYKPEIQMHPEIMKHIAKQEDFKKLFLDNDNIYTLLNAMKDKQFNNSTDKYFENFLNITFANIETEKITSLSNPKTKEILHDYDNFLERKKIIKERENLSKQLENSDTISVLKDKSNTRHKI
jgi:hypothetical protein